MVSFSITYSIPNGVRWRSPLPLAKQTLAAACVSRVRAPTHKADRRMSRARANVKRGHPVIKGELDHVFHEEQPGYKRDEN